MKMRCRKSQKIDFRNKLNDKFESRPEIDQVPYKYFMPSNESKNDDEKVIDTTNLKLDINENANKCGIKRKRIEKTPKSRASLVLEQFLPVRPEIQQLWDKNILPSLPPSPQKIQTFSYNKKGKKCKKDANLEYQSLFGFDTLQHTPSPLQQPEPSKNITMDMKHEHEHEHKTLPTQSVPSVHDSRADSSNYSPITLQRLYIDKRRNRRHDSMAMLELKLFDIAPRESLFELGILIMSPAPSPPPLSVIRQTQPIENKSIFDHESDNKTNDNELYNTQSRKRRIK